ncbi:hypothetical protein HYN59_14420 [Flavobacterium album]|uniref:Uncharacterized protein n=1 Tax=Flavobacterium album TaxID=2175091 RepID=A0A2S1R0P4_9FLAO|nr:hypothetical protein HYN59_14420 [Flavobacterium album]
MYSSSVILTTKPEEYFQYIGLAEIIKPNKINPDSFGGSVYVDIGESGWQTTNINIILKGLSDSEKQFFRNL